MVSSNGATSTPSPRLFTTWFTSISDNTDHAVTDEEFAAGNGTAVAVCGTTVVFGPMEWAPGPRCPNCETALGAAAESAAVPAWLPVDNPKPPWVCAIHSMRGILDPCRRVTTYVDSTPRTSSETAATHAGDRSKPPGGGRPGISIGVTAGAETTNTPVSVPAHSPIAPKHPAVTSPPECGWADLETPTIPMPRRLQVPAQAARRP